MGPWKTITNILIGQIVVPREAVPCWHGKCNQFYCMIWLCGRSCNFFLLYSVLTALTWNWSLKLSNVEPGQYLDGRPSGNTGCCWQSNISLLSLVREGLLQSFLPTLVIQDTLAHTHTSCGAGDSALPTIHLFDSLLHCLLALQAPLYYRMTRMPTFYWLH